MDLKFDPTALTCGDQEGRYNSSWAWQRLFPMSKELVSRSTVAMENARGHIIAFRVFLAIFSQSERIKTLMIKASDDPTIGDEGTPQRKVTKSS